jgi:hypothetical protein
MYTIIKKILAYIKKNCNFAEQIECSTKNQLK